MIITRNVTCIDAAESICTLYCKKKKHKKKHPVLTYQMLGFWDQQCPSCPQCFPLHAHSHQRAQFGTRWMYAGCTPNKQRTMTVALCQYSTGRQGEIWRVWRRDHNVISTNVYFVQQCMRMRNNHMPSFPSSIFKLNCVTILCKKHWVASKWSLGMRLAWCQVMSKEHNIII